MKILVVGGAGYIGSSVVYALEQKGYDLTVFDNLSLGHKQALSKNTKLLVGDLNNYSEIKNALKSEKIDTVMHFAAFSLVGESVQNPIKYYQNNVANTINLFKAMEEVGVKNFVFSSTAAVFGNPIETPITEYHPINPINPYGLSKSMVEFVLKDLAEKGKINYVSLRYFNAAGAVPDGSIGEAHANETHLIPLVLKSILHKDSGFNLKVFGTDYETPDGTCLRDYIHVLDLAEAHILAVDHLVKGSESEFFNLGTGKGFSVLDIIKAAEKVTGEKIPYETAERREGDPPVLVASSEKITEMLGWKPQFPEIESIIETAWKWHKNNPNGYKQNNII